MFFFNYPVTKSNGTAILCNNPGLKINNILFFDEGRTTIVQLQKNGMDYTILMCTHLLILHKGVFILMIY